MGLLDGKVAVITGAGSGMAKASTKLFVAEGAKVVAAAEFGRVDAVLNVAGIGLAAPLHTFPTSVYNAAKAGVASLTKSASFVSVAIIPVDGGWSARLP